VFGFLTNSVLSVGKGGVLLEEDIRRKKGMGCLLIVQDLQTPVSAQVLSGRGGNYKEEVRIKIGSEGM